MSKNKLNKIFLIIVSFQTILMSILFIIQILRIYYGSDSINPFTRDICKQYLLEILPVIIIWILVIIGSGIYFVIKDEKNKSKIKISNVTKLKNLNKICPLDIDINYPFEYELLNKEKKKRFIGMVINICIIIICSIMGLGYLLNVKHFDSQGDLTNQAIQMGVHLLPWCIIGFLSFIGYSIYEEYSSKKSIEIIREIIKNSGKNKVKKEINQKRNLVLNIVRISVLVVAVTFIIHGITNGGAYDVLQKAINICTECIGLG